MVTIDQAINDMNKNELKNGCTTSGEIIILLNRLKSLENVNIKVYNDKYNRQITYIEQYKNSYYQFCYNDCYEIKYEYIKEILNALNINVNISYIKQKIDSNFVINANKINYNKDELYKSIKELCKNFNKNNITHIDIFDYSKIYENVVRLELQLKYKSEDYSFGFSTITVYNANKIELNYDERIYKEIYIKENEYVNLKISDFIEPEKEIKKIINSKFLNNMSDNLIKYFDDINSKQND